MAGTRLSLGYGLTVALGWCCCLSFAGTSPAPAAGPGNGQNLSSAPSSTMSHFTPAHNEADNLSSWTIAPTSATMDGNITVTSYLSDNSSSLSEHLTPTTLGSLNTTGHQNTDSVISSSTGILSFSTPTASLVEGNQSNLDNADLINTTSLVGLSTTFTTMEPFQSEAQGSTTVLQPHSSTFSTLGPTKGRPESIPVTDHEAIAENNITVSSSAPKSTGGELLLLNASSTVTLTPPFVSSTHIAHSHTPAETEQPVNHVQKTSVADVRDDDLPSMSEANAIGNDPLVIAVIFIFSVTVGIVALMGFLKYRQHSSRLQFRRLQDLPMDDMMEDTPLSLYSY